MAIKSSGNSLAFSEIEAEFGQNGRSLGGYRLTQNVGSLSNLPDSGIPTSGQINLVIFMEKD